MKAWTSTWAFVVLGSAAMAIHPCPVSAADNTDLARQHYKKASQFYDVGRFDEALAEYEKAYTLREDPSLLFNMAQTCRRKGDLKRALDLYKNYLVKEPESPMRAEVESRIKALKPQVEQAEKPAPEASKEGAALAPVVAPIPVGGPQALEPPTPIPPSTPPTSAPVSPAVAPAPTVMPSPTVLPAPMGMPTPVPATTPGTSGPMTAPALAPAAFPPAQPPASPPGTPAPGYFPAPSAAPPSPMPFAPAPAPFAAAPVAVAQQPAPAPSQPAQATGSSGLPLIITGTIVTAGGLVCLGLGVYNAVQTKLLSDKVTSAKTFSPSNDEQGKRAYKLQWIEGGIGIGAIVVGATLYTIGSIQRSSYQSKVAFVPVVQPDGAMLAATGGF